MADQDDQEPLLTYVFRRGTEVKIRQGIGVPPPAYHDYLEALRKAAIKSGSAAEIADCLIVHPQLMVEGRLASLYLDKLGVFHLLLPHTHAAVATQVIRAVERGKLYKPIQGRGATFVDLTRRTGIIRAQFYPTGVGCSILTSVPPTYAQVRALQAYWSLTTCEVFVIEVYDHGELVGRLSGVKSLVRLIIWLRRGLDIQELLASRPEE